MSWSKAHRKEIMNLFELLEAYAYTLNKEGKDKADRFLENCAATEVIKHIKRSFVKDTNGVYQAARHDDEGTVYPGDFVFGPENAQS